MSYSIQAQGVFNRLILERSSGYLESAGARPGLTDDRVTKYLTTCDAKVLSDVTAFMRYLADARSPEYQRALFSHLIGIFSTIEEIAQSNHENLVLFQTILQSASDFIFNNWNSYAAYFEPEIPSTIHWAIQKCCFAEVQEFCRQALVTEDEEDSEVEETAEGDDEDEATVLPGNFARLYGICCRVMWQVIGNERLADRLESAEAAKEPDEEADNDPSGKAASAVDNRAVKDCRCLDAVIYRRLVPSTSSKQQQKNGKAKKQQAWRRRFTGTARDDRWLIPSPLSLPPITAEPETDEQIT
ncbi:hypothetical protein F5Y05DRAFT_416914 [Hypoxylon sp. FL0543]|nr:hypothetical protein F5Y05DRAFT_416914 [Hypoxylon sp. FL0543]